MKVAKTADWRDGVPFDTPMVAAEVAPGEPTRCFVCGTESEPLDRTELWAVKHQHPHHHDGYVRFYCAEHTPKIARPVAPTIPVAKSGARRAAPRPAGSSERQAPAVRRSPVTDEKPRAMCPDCFIEVSALGLCGVCGQTVA